MSLKAKLEAVIYAAEEPVTLAQIAALFQAELLEERQSRLSAEAASREELSSAEEPALALEPAVVLQEEANVKAGSAAEKAASDASSEPSNSAAEEEKRAARQRDRETRDEARRVVAQLISEYAEGDRGMEIREIAGGYRVATKPEYHDAVRVFIKSLKPAMKLSLQALETLAVIAYKQPVTAPEVSEIRGVDSAGVLGSLVSRKLITTAGRKQVIGRPILYKTTKEFLLRFGLKDLNELPSIEEFEKMAGELAETEDALPVGELPLEEQPRAADEVNQTDEGTG
jgi:segregation and condensation protein B